MNLELDQFEVYAVDEYGAVQLECKNCERIIAEGGCTCCKDNAATLDRLIDAAESHACTGPPEENE